MQTTSLTTEILTRKGARKPADIPDQVLLLLNRGEIETVNLTEWLAIDQVQLLKHTFPKIGLSDSLATVIHEIKKLPKASTMAVIKSVGESLYQYQVENNTLDSAILSLSQHPADTLRCYATYLIALNENLTLQQQLTQSMDLVADKHFGVREVVWMALRPELVKDLKLSLALLEDWTQHPDANIRRFTTEATRPRGVWCKHIESLKEKPEQALSILNQLKDDQSKYVQDSVGNWLNDASKTRPDFVEQLCQNWLKESTSTATNYIVKRAKRSIAKKA